MERLDRDKCIALLRQKQAELQSAGDLRLPQRSDFSEEEIVAVKAFLGPWPRALEAAGLKAPGNEKRLQLRAEKRIRARRRKTQAKLEGRSAERQEPVVSGQEPKSNT